MNFIRGQTHDCGRPFCLNSRSSSSSVMVMAAGCLSLGRDKKGKKKKKRKKKKQGRAGATGDEQDDAACECGLAVGWDLVDDGIGDGARRPGLSWENRP